MVSAFLVYYYTTTRRCISSLFTFLSLERVDDGDFDGRKKCSTFLHFVKSDLLLDNDIL